MIGILQNKNLNDKKMSEIVNWHYIIVEKMLKLSKVKLLYNRTIKQLENDLGRIHLKDIITASPNELVKLVNVLPHDKINKYIVRGSQEHFFCYLYSKYRKKYGAELAKKLEVTVCPYCNRNFINTKGDKAPVQFDHFFNKSKYPIFSLSLYNLIPCCGTCNQWKGTSDFEISLYDSNYNTDDMVQFSYFPTDCDEFEIEVKPLNPIMKINIDKLQLKEIYSTHTDLIRELIKKKQFYNQYNIKFLQDLADKNGMPNNMNVKEFLYGNYLSQDKYYLRPLSKFTRDILIELDQHNCSYE